MAKANKLLISTRQKIGKYKDDNPNVTLNELAIKFNCTFNQARKAVDDWKSGSLKRPRTKKVNIITSNDVINANPDEMLERQFNLAVTGLDQNNELSVDERINLLDKCIKIRKVLQSLRLERHIKRADAVLIGILVRMFEPNATDDRVIELYNEAVEIYHNDKG